jgi:predicted DCC family thiol-disulfide oxidoreductase YuxK
MNPVTHVVLPPTKPILVFDGDCNFCRRWIARWREMTGDLVEYHPFQDAYISERFSEIPREQFEGAVQLIEPDGRVSGGAQAVFRTLGYAPHKRWTLWAYENVPGVDAFTEFWYRVVAQNRTVFSWLTRLLWGDHVERPRYLLTRWVFLRFLGIIYLCAFVSLWTQVGGLVGHNGILPADQMMQSIHQQVEKQQIGFARYYLVPTLCWINSSDQFLNLLCGAGTVLSVALVFGVAPAPVLFLLWLIYLSLSTVCREFLSFQWDILLLETGFLAIFFAPLQMLPRLSHEALQPSTVLWLLRWLLFRLMFGSGVVKLASGDPTWRNLTALTYHYETQPLPTWIGWYANLLPVWFQKFSCAVMFGIELGAPFLIFLPRRPRLIGCGLLIFLQLCIILTGNYCFFNLLAIAMCLLLLDDAALGRLMPHKLVEGAKQAAGKLRWSKWIIAPIAVVILVTSSMLLTHAFRTRVEWPEPLVRLYVWIEPFRSVSSYGLFAVMTTERDEIIVEGSNDAVRWLPYEFKYKPGDLTRRPAFVAPHQPRLDWQMWFAALGSYRNNPWFINFCERLLQGSPEVLALMKVNPFPNAPPRYIRAVMYQYHMTDLATRRATGNWWRRDKERLYCPVLSLRGAE